MEFVPEEWVDQFANKIPSGNYSIQLELSDENGLLVHLYSKSFHVLLDFGLVRGVNVLEEGVQLNYLPNCRCDEDILPQSGFQSVVYLIRNGRYAQYIKLYMGEVLFEALRLTQFNVVTQNHVVMIVSPDEPIITITEG